MKKLIALLLAMLMVTSMVACGGNDTPETTNGTNPPETDPASVEATEATEPMTNAERYPLESDTVFRVLFSDEGVEVPETVELWSRITGVEVEALTWTSEQLKTSLAAGDFPDATVQPYGLTKDMVYEYGVAGKFIDFTDYLHLMPNLSAMIEKYPEIMNVCMYPDGAMYSLPKISWTPTAQGNVLYIRTDMMNELGWEKAPATTDEFIQYIKEAQEHFGASDSKFVAFHCRDKSYMKWNSTNTLATYFFPSFGELVETGLTLDADGNVVLGAATEQYKHYLEFMHEIWESGAFETEIYTMDSTAGKAAIQGLHVAVSAATYEGSDSTAAVTVLEPLTSEYQAEKQWLKNPTVNYVGCVVSSACADIETMVKFLDSFYSTEENPLNEEGTVWGASWFVGELGVDWEKDDEAMTYTKIDGGITYYSNSLCLQEFTYVNDGSLYVKGMGTLVNCLPYAVEKSGVTDLTLTEDDQDTYSDCWTDIDSYISQMTAKFITGEEDIEAGWAAYLSNLEKMGLDEVLDIYQNTYDAK